MLSEDKYFQTLTEDELWQRYCGFLDLSIDDFMDIQRGLLMDEIDRVADSPLGRKIMGNQKPKSVEEFRHMVPLTTYKDYEPYLSERQEDVLASKPEYWCHSSGKGGYFKWIPHSSKFLDISIKNCIAVFILGSTKQKNQVNISPGFRFLSIVAPVPYFSGSLFNALSRRISTQIIPPPGETENLEFQERMQRGFQIALRDGADIIGCLASVLVRMGEAFGGGTQGKRLSRTMLHPKVVLRLVRAWLRSKKDNRAILPKDIWPTKAIMCGGLDTAIYKDDVAHYWGSEPYEVYICTEGGFIAIQGWNRKALTFLPDSVFLEFIPYEEQVEHIGGDYQPPTVLLSEIQEGKLYEIVVTQLYGMPLLRYRMQDIIKVVSLRDEEAGVNLPQINFQRRSGETIDLAGLAKLDEKTIWRAIAYTGIKYADWSACKEYDQGKSFLRLYLELKEQREADEVAAMIDEQLKKVDTDYKDIDSYLDLEPIKVTLLSPGTFQHYMEKRREEGADLAHLKAARINTPEGVIRTLCQFSDEARKSS